MKKSVLSLLFVLCLCLMAGCAPGPNVAADTPDAEGAVAGFWPGLWHGVISPVTFVVSLFKDEVGMYEVHNNGGWYDFGFLLGVSIAFGGGAAGGSAGRSRRER